MAVRVGLEIASRITRERRTALRRRARAIAASPRIQTRATRIEPRLIRAAIERGVDLVTANKSMLAHALPPRPRGVFRGTFAEFERLDELRRLEIARKLNTV